MIEPLSGFLASLRQTSPVIFLGLSIATGAILFIGEDAAHTLGISDLRNQYRGELGLLFIGSISLVVAQALWGAGRIGSSIAKDLRDKRKAQQNLQAKQKELEKLTPDEKAYLVPYIIEPQKNTQYFEIDDGIAGGLAAKHIIYQASSVGGLISGFAFNLQPWAREHLQAHPELLVGASEGQAGPPEW